MGVRIRTLSPRQWALHRRALLHFVHRAGDGHITVRSARCLAALQPAELPQPGNAVLVAQAPGGAVVGLLAFADHGRRFSVVAVHPDWRRRGIGKGLLAAVLQRVDEFHTRVVAGNMASLKLHRSQGWRVHGAGLSAAGRVVWHLIWKGEQRGEGTAPGVAGHPGAGAYERPASLR